MPNFQNRSAFGDIYQIPTGGIDGIAKMVYQEQKQREQQKLQQDKALDDEFAKNVAGVKSADIPEISQAYNEFKQAHINLQKKGNKATPQDQMDVMLKKANAFQAINSSKEDKERLKQYAATVKSDTKGIYDPNAPQMVNTWLNTPTSKRNLDEDANLKYKYAMPNIDKDIEYATKRDDGSDFNITVGVDPNDPLKDKVESYKRINPPNVFYNRLFTKLGSRSDNRGFSRLTLDSMDDSEKDKLRTDFETRIQDPKFKALYGEVQPFPASAANTELGQAVALKTMEAFVKLPIDAIKSDSKLNLGRSNAEKRKYNEGESDRRAERNQRYSLIKIDANKRAQVGGGGETSGNALDEIGVVNDVHLDVSGGKISQGVVYDKDNNLYTGEVALKKGDLPSNLTTSLIAAKIPLSTYMNVVVKDGVIQSIKTKNGEVSRQAMENLQKNIDKEPMKNPKWKFGSSKGGNSPNKPAAKFDDL